MPGNIHLPTARASYNHMPNPLSSAAPFDVPGPAYMPRENLRRSLNTMGLVASAASSNSPSEATTPYSGHSRRSSGASSTRYGHQNGPTEYKPSFQLPPRFSQNHTAMPNAPPNDQPPAVSRLERLRQWPPQSITGQAERPNHDNLQHIPMLYNFSPAPIPAPQRDPFGFHLPTVISTPVPDPSCFAPPIQADVIGVIGDRRPLFSTS